MKFLAGLLLGLIVSSVYFLNRPTTVPEKTKKEFKVLVGKEAKAFAEAGDATAKLKAAEELYGRMIVLFMANLGLELQKSRTFEIHSEEIPSAPATSRDTEKASLTCAPCNASATPSAESKKENPKLTTAEKFKNTPYQNKMDPLIRKMLGVFVGKLSYFAGSRRGKIDGALIELDLVQKEDQLNGQIAVILTDENNKPYSRNRGKGGNKTIRYNQSDKMVYVEASPNSFFAFRAPEFNGQEVRGEYYEDNALVGNAILYRQ